MTPAPARITLALVVLATLVGCRSLDIGPGGSLPPAEGSVPPADGSVAPTAGEIAHDDGDALLLRVEHRGGFVPYEYLLSRAPHFSLHGDGRVVVTGAVPAIYPGPILPPLLERRLTEEGIQQVLRAALDSGALERSTEWNGARSHVADAADTVFTLNAGGDSVVVSIYALGIGGMEMSGLGEKERRAHEALSELEGSLNDLESWLPPDAWADDGWQPYRADALRLVTRNADGDAPSQDGVSLHVVPWPLPGDPAEFGERAGLDGSRCGVVTGADAEAWYAVLDEADQLTRFEGGGHRHAVVPRPLLPDEPASCGPLA